jgi:anti-sigma B factor antagonist
MASILNTSLNNDTLKVAVTAARLDALAVREFKAGIEAAWSPAVRRVVIDLSPVSFVDSSGVGALLSVFKKLEAPASVKLLHLQPPVQSVIELLRLHRVFEISA